jgi:serine/threonine protein kinase
MEEIKPQYDWLETTQTLPSASQTKHGQAVRLQLVKKRTRRFYGRQTDPQLYVCKVIACGAGTNYFARNAAREYNILKKLRHPHILAYADFAYTYSRDFIGVSRLYTKFCANGDLGLFLPKRRKAGQFTENYAWGVALQVSSALVYLHYGATLLLDRDKGYSKLELAEWRYNFKSEKKHYVYLHRDIKPENSKFRQAKSLLLLIFPVFINRLRQDHIEVQLGDFGLAKELDEDTSHTYVGTRDYIAPVRCLTKDADDMSAINLCAYSGVGM